MTIQSELNKGFTHLLDNASESIRVRYYTTTIGSVWDDEVSYSKSGADYWVSGIVLPVVSADGSEESILMEQGKLLNGDKKVYVNGSIAFTGSILDVDLQIGSPTGDLYSSILDGGLRYYISSTPIYTKFYVRKLTGSTL